MKDQDNLRRLRREWYHRNREQEAEKQRLRKQVRQEQIQAYLVNLKEITPCADCHKYFPACAMDFDHLGDKEFSLSSHNGSKSLATIEREVSKCEIVCAVCHRIRTWNRSHGGGVTAT